MSHCPHCGKEIGDASFAFCPHCGGALQESGGFDVVLVNSGDKHIKVIKELRAMTGFGLKEAKDLSERTPALLAQKVPRSQADAIRSRLEQHGAVVEVRAAGAPGGSVGAAPLDDLGASGALDPRELDTARQIISVRPASEAQELVDLLSGLYELHRSGVLTESEFNAKKWEILSS